MNFHRFRPRFTVRRLMVAAALAALTSFGCYLWRRSAEYAKKAESHNNMASVCWANSSRVGTGFGGSRPDPSQRLSAEQEEERAALELQARYEEQMSRKYRRASRYPWLSIEPDPPRPPDPPEPEEIRILLKDPFDPKELSAFHNSRYPLHPVESDTPGPKDLNEPK